MATADAITMLTNNKQNLVMVNYNDL